MAASDLESKLELAMLAYAESIPLSTTNLYTGEGNEDKETPCIIFSAEGGPELEPNTGIYNLTAKVIVRSPATIDTDTIDPKPIHDDLVATIMDAFEIGNLAEMLSYYGTALTVQGVVFGSRNRTDSGDHWESSLEFTAPCSGSSIP